MCSVNSYGALGKGCDVRAALMFRRGDVAVFLSSSPNLTLLFYPLPQQAQSLVQKVLSLGSQGIAAEALCRACF